MTAFATFVAVGMCAVAVYLLGERHGRIREHERFTAETRTLWADHVRRRELLERGLRLDRQIIADELARIDTEAE